MLPTTNVSSGQLVKEKLTHSDKVKQKMISVVLPAFNEEAIIEANLSRLYAYLESLESIDSFEMVIVNDGSKDDTGRLAEDFANLYPGVRVFHHQVNRNLGGALRTGFYNSKGEIVVVLDLDLSYSEDHIPLLLDCMEVEKADIVVASPYMKGGKSTAVPYKRLMLSKVVNRMMRFMAPSSIHTYTGMVRAYRKSFLEQLHLRAADYSINPEIIHKALILRARIREIPAHLDWTEQNKLGKSRTSSIRIFRGILSGLMGGFIFRPYLFFFTIGGVLFLLSSYVITWVFINSFSAMSEIGPEIVGLEGRFSAAVALVFQERPYSFVVGGISLIIALQFLGISFLSLQNKRYFDELFHLNTKLYNRS